MSVEIYKFCVGGHCPKCTEKKSKCKAQKRKYKYDKLVSHYSYRRIIATSQQKIICSLIFDIWNLENRIFLFDYFTPFAAKIARNCSGSDAYSFATSGVIC